MKTNEREKQVKASVFNFNELETLSMKIRVVISTLVKISLLTLGIIAVILVGYTTVSLLKLSLIETAIITADRAEWEITAIKNIVHELGRNEMLSNDSYSIDEKRAVVDRRVESYGYYGASIIGRDGIGLYDYVDYNHYDFFINAMAGETYITSPMAMGGQMLIVISSPIFKDGEDSGEIVGVVMVVVDHETLSDIVHAIEICDGDSAYILNGFGTAVAHTEPNMVSSFNNNMNLATTDSSLATIAKIEAEMIQGQIGFNTYLYDGVVQFIAYAPIANTSGWTIAITAPLIEFLGPMTTCIIVLIVVIIVFSLISNKLAVRFGNGIGEPIKECCERIGLLVQGDLSSAVPVFDTKDEIKILGDSTKEITHELNNIIGDIQYLLERMAEGDFTINSQKKEVYIGDFATILLSLNDIKMKLGGTLHQIGDAMSDVQEGSVQLAENAVDMSEGAIEQDAALEELAASIANVHEISAHNAEETQGAADKIGAAVEGTENGKQAVADLVKAMEAISITSNEIESIIVDIEGIASQTNLLSLNASIEAARAGESGRGFSIVAQQIGTLAEDSARSAVNTKELIMKSLEEVEKGNRYTEITLKAFNEVIISMQEFAEVTKTLNNNSHQQDELIEQITEAIEQIAKVVHLNTSAAQETTAVSEELAAQITNIDDLIHQFKF
ncbi:MAG: methyl-accepting chemotaxis protein [Eubacteriales bacterium]